MGRRDPVINVLNFALLLSSHVKSLLCDNAVACGQQFFSRGCRPHSVNKLIKISLINLRHHGHDVWRQKFLNVTFGTQSILLTDTSVLIRLNALFSKSFDFLVTDINLRIFFLVSLDLGLAAISSWCC